MFCGVSRCDACGGGYDNRTVHDCPARAAALEALRTKLNALVRDLPELPKNPPRVEAHQRLLDEISADAEKNKNVGRIEGGAPLRRGEGVLGVPGAISQLSDLDALHSVPAHYAYTATHDAQPCRLAGI